MPGKSMLFTQPIEQRINEMIAGMRSDVGIKIFGDDLHQLDGIADRIVDVLKSIRGAR